MENPAYPSEPLISVTVMGDGVANPGTTANGAVNPGTSADGVVYPGMTADAPAETQSRQLGMPMSSSQGEEALNIQLPNQAPTLAGLKPARSQNRTVGMPMSSSRGEEALNIQLPNQAPALADNAIVYGAEPPHVAVTDFDNTSDVADGPAAH
eukprot:gene20837-27669_t